VREGVDWVRKGVAAATTATTAARQSESGRRESWLL